MLRRFSSSSHNSYHKISSSSKILSNLRFCASSSFSSSSQQQQQNYINLNENPRWIGGVGDGNNNDDDEQKGQFRIHHDALGTGRFVAVGMGRKESNYNKVSIVATCDVTERVLDLKEHLQATKKNASALALFSTSNSNNNHYGETGSSRMHDPHSGRPGKYVTSMKRNAKNNHQQNKQTAPMCEDDEASRIPTPVTFSIYLENTNGGGPLHQQNKKGGDSAVCIIASCIGESSISIDGLSFVKSVRHALEASVTSVMDRRDNYQGPQLHQGVLAECSFNTSFLTPNPIYRPRQHRNLSLRPNFNAKYSPFARYGAHFPVHTIQPELYDGIFEWCRDMGIDDGFAKEMRLVALERTEKELKNWNFQMKEQVQEITMRRKKSDRVV